VRARLTTTTTIQNTEQHRDRPGVARRPARASRRARPGVPVRTVPPAHTLGFHMRPCAAGIRVAEFRHAALRRRDPAIRRDPRSLAAFWSHPRCPYPDTQLADPLPQPLLEPPTLPLPRYTAGRSPLLFVFIFLKSSTKKLRLTLLPEGTDKQACCAGRRKNRFRTAQYLPRLLVPAFQYDPVRPLSGEEGIGTAYHG